jgi:hypothetical protein
LSQFRPHFAASDHAAGLLASRRQDSACLRSESANFTAMGSRCWCYSGENGREAKMSSNFIAVDFWENSLYSSYTHIQYILNIAFTSLLGLIHRELSR